MVVTGHTSGIYRLFEADRDGDLLLLDERAPYLLTDGASGGRIVAGDRRREPHRLISQGIYHMVVASGAGNLPDGHYLLLEGANRMYTIWRLDGALPTEGSSTSFRPDLDRILTQDDVDALLARRTGE